MKTLIFLLMGVFCFAHGQSKPKEDSIVQSITEKINATNKINRENEILLNQIIVAKKAKEAEFTAKKNSPVTEKTVNKSLSKSEAIKTDNITPEIEVDFKVYEEFIRGGFFYGILHKDDYKIKYYKIVGDEKVYLN